MPPRSYRWEQPQVTCPGWIVLWSHWSPEELGWVPRCCCRSHNPPCCHSLQSAFPLNPGFTGSMFLHFPQGWAVVSLERGWENKQIKIKLAEWDPDYFGVLSESPRPLRIVAERLRVEYLTVPSLPGLIGQLTSQTAGDFTDCSTNHVSKHSCSLIQNMPWPYSLLVLTPECRGIVNASDLRISNFTGMQFA